MSTMDIRIPEEQVSLLVQKAIFETLTPEMRNDIIQKAVRDLLSKPESPHSYDKSTHLERIFSEAVRGIALTIAKDELARDKRMEVEIRKLINDAFDKMIGEGREKIVQNLAWAIERGLSGKER